MSQIAVGYFNNYKINIYLIYVYGVEKAFVCIIYSYCFLFHFIAYRGYRTIEDFSVHLR